HPAAPNADDFPGSVCVTKPENARWGNCWGTIGYSRTEALTSGAASEGRRDAPAGWAQRRGHETVPARILRRPTAAHRHSAGPDSAAKVGGRGRARLSAGCFCGRSGAAFVAGVAARVRADLHFYLAQLACGGASCNVRGRNAGRKISR